MVPGYLRLLRDIIPFKRRLVYILHAVYVDMTLHWLKGTHYLMLLGINCCSSQDTLYKATRVVNSLLRIQDNHNDSPSCINPGFKLHLVPADSVAQIAKYHPSPELAYAFQGFFLPTQMAFVSDQRTLIPSMTHFPISLKGSKLTAQM